MSTATLDAIEDIPTASIDIMRHACERSEAREGGTALCGHVFKNVAPSARPLRYDATRRQCATCRVLARQRGWG